jgi:hypothetical protein
LCATLAVTAAAAQDRNFIVSAHGWFPAMAVDAIIDSPDGSVSTEVSTSATVILGALKFGVFGTAQTRRGRFGLFGNASYDDLGVSETGPLGARRSVGADLFMVTGAAARRLREDGGSFVDAHGGGRLASLDSTVTVGSNSAPKSTTYVNPLIGIRAGYAPTDRVRLNASASIGAYGTGSDFAWKACAGANHASASVSSPTSATAIS